MTRLSRQQALLAGGAAVSVLAGIAVSALQRGGGPRVLSKYVRTDDVLVASATFLSFLAAGMRTGARERREREQRLLDLNRALRQRERDLEHLATTDALTALHNRRYFFDRVGVEFRRAGRYGRPISCILLDVDNFKAVNDEHGHRHGDFVLAELALILAQGVRESDVLARYGGDEFVILLPEAAAGDAAAVAEWIGAAVRAHVFDDGIASTRITVSQGLATYPDHGVATPEALVQAADSALLDAKRQGRDRMELSGRSNRAAG